MILSLPSGKCKFFQAMVVYLDRYFRNEAISLITLPNPFKPVILLLNVFTTSSENYFDYWIDDNNVT